MCASSSSLLLVVVLLLLSLAPAVHPQPPIPRGFFLDCGAAVRLEIDGLSWQPDAPFISSGVPRNLSVPGLLPTLSTLRSFPFRFSGRRRKFCYAVPVFRGARYLVRTTYFYGGPGSPPVFDQIVDGTLWTVVNTTEDYARNTASYYEGVFKATRRNMSICIGGNTYTDSDPFISALELILLEDSMYNATDFSRNGMGLIARSSFGSSGPAVRYPDDRFDRYWQPFIDSSHAMNSTDYISVSRFWNLPPANVLSTALTADQRQAVELQWPAISLPNSSYYIALYFADTLNRSSRIFDVFINGYSFYNDLQVTSAGLTVFATPWILSGLTRIMLIPKSALPPVINAGEVFGLFPLNGLTITRDVIALDNIKKGFLNPPLDWDGDPCFPREYSWTGVTCSEGSRIRVVALNLSSMGLSGSLSPSINNLTALTSISFANNNLRGPIPNFSRLRRLETLHLQDNQFSGEIPSSLGNLKNLHELFLQNNNLTGEIPSSLRTKPGLNLQVSPGNHLRPAPPLR